MAVNHLRKVMEGSVQSKRHKLFLDRRERECCSGIEILSSRLYQLSNPGFLGDQDWSIVVSELMENVFKKYLDEVSRSENNFILNLHVFFIFVG